MKRISLLSLPLAFFIGLSSADTITLVNGDQLHGDILELTDNFVRLHHPSLGEITIDKLNITTIAAEGAVENPTAIIAEVTEKEEGVVDNGLFGTGLMENWTRRFSLSFNGETGSTEELNADTSFNAKFSTDYERWAFNLDYGYGSENHETTENDLGAFLIRDWLDPDSPWFSFASGQYDQDKFKSWDYRLIGTVGLGYTFVKEEDYLFVGRMGLSGRQEFGSDNDDFKPEMMFGFNTDWDISETQSLEFNTATFLPFERPADSRNESSLYWRIKLDTKKGMSVKLGLENEYESVVDPGDDHNDFTYNFGIEWDLN